MKWISIKDRLPIPSYDVRILAYGVPVCGTCGNEPGNKPVIQFCIFNVHYYLIQKYIFTFGEYDCELDATHWMPLPEPPEQE